MLSLGEILKLLAPADLQAFVKRGLTVAFVCVIEIIIAIPHSLYLAEMGYIVHLQSQVEVLKRRQTTGFCALQQSIYSVESIDSMS